MFKQLKQNFALRPIWMNAVMGFCFFMTFIYLPWDIFIKPLAEDQEVWFGVQETIDWFLPTLAKRLRAGDQQAQKEFVRLNNTPNRRVLKFKPVKKIGFDSRKMRQATLDAGQG